MSKFDEEMPPPDFPPEATPERSKKNGNGEAHPEFPYVWVNDAKLDLSINPIVKGLIEPGSFTLIYGPSGSGKSFFTADLAQHIATGQNWRGRKVEQVMVVYVASEAGASILKRFVAWRDNRIGEASGPIPLAILTRGPNLLQTVDVEHLILQLKAMQAHCGRRVGFVIFDTLSRSIPGGDENTAEDMTMIVRAADILRDEFGCATTYVHHTGKDPSKGARGHSSLFAAADLVMCVEDKAATVEKVRDGVSGERFAFGLQPVEIGIDQDGDMVYSCLLQASDQPASQSKRAEPQGKNQKILIKEARTLAIDGNISAGSSEIPQGVRLIRFPDLVERALPKFPGIEPFRARARISEAVVALQASGHFGVHGELIWLI